MGVAISDDGIIIGANIDVSRIQQAASKMKSLIPYTATVRKI